MSVFNKCSLVLKYITEGRKARNTPSSSSGFTMLEILVVLAIVGILSAISAPAFLGFINRQRLNTAQGRLYLSIREAQSLAKTPTLNKPIAQTQVAFRTLGSSAQYVVSSRLPSTANVSDWNSLPWKNLDPAIRFDIPNMTFTQLSAVPIPPIRRVIFDNKGNVIGNLGKVTVTNQFGSGSKACVIVSTLLGAARTAKDSNCN